MRLTQQDLKEVIEHQVRYDNLRAPRAASFAADLPDAEWWQEVKRAADFRHQLDEGEVS